MAYSDRISSKAETVDVNGTEVQRSTLEFVTPNESDLGKNFDKFLLTILITDSDHILRFLQLSFKFISSRMTHSAKIFHALIWSCLNDVSEV